jgi:hypothetical protein
MNSRMSGKASAMELCDLWESILEDEGLSAEVRYRIRKLIDRTRPLLDKMFVKTVKGREMILQCSDMTRVIHDRLRSRQGNVFSLMTDLERTYEDFLKKTYEFRVKAG